MIATLRCLRFRSPIKSPASAVLRDRRRQARTAVLLLVGLSVILNLFLGWSMEGGNPLAHWRDPEYGRRVLRAQRFLDQHPDRPFVAFFGSSRVSMGIAPNAFPQSVKDRATTFNFSLFGAGPILQLLTYERLRTDGIHPQHVIIEFWPAFFSDIKGRETARIDPMRLYRRDLPILAPYWHEEMSSFEKIVERARWKPIFDHRLYLLSMVAPSWLPWNNRRDLGYVGMDAFGWLPGLPDDPDPTRRALRHQSAWNYYRDALVDWQPSPSGTAALRHLLRRCREDGTAVTFLWLPESSEFQSWYTPVSRTRIDAWLAAIHQEFQVPLLDTRSFAADADLLDGFHLTRQGAERYSRRLGETLADDLIRTRRLPPARKTADAP